MASGIHIKAPSPQSAVGLYFGALRSLDSDRSSEPRKSLNLAVFRETRDPAFFLCRQCGAETAQLLLSTRSKENNPNVFDFIGRSPTIEQSFIGGGLSSKENQFRTDGGATVCCTDSEGRLAPARSDPAFSLSANEGRVLAEAGSPDRSMEKRRGDSGYRFEISPDSAQSSAELRTESTLQQRPCFFQLMKIF